MFNRRWLPIVFLITALLLPGRVQAGTEVPATISIQSLIDNAPVGSTVNVPAGTYQESLTINKDLTLSGAGIGATIVMAPPSQRVLVISGAVTVHLQHLTITGGHVQPSGGGGIWANGATTYIDDCLVADNSASYGGGLYQDGSGNTYVSSSRFERNTASDHGGALFISNGGLSLSGTDIVSNQALGHGGGITVWAGATSVLGGQFVDNRAGLNGGALNLNNSVVVTGTAFVNNSAGDNGGALVEWNAGQMVQVTGARFEGNSARSQGGGLWVHGDLSLSASSFISNSITGSGFAGARVYAADGTTHPLYADFQGNSSGSSGGGALFSSGTTVITNTLFADNQAGLAQGAAIEFDGAVHRKLSFVTVAYSTTTTGPAVLMTSGDLDMADSIIASVSTGIALTDGSLYQAYGLFGNCAEPVSTSGGATRHDGAGMLFPSDAGFRNPSARDYRLRLSSPAVDSGIDVGVYVDLEGDRRPIGKGYDMGMDEAGLTTFLPAVLK